jgi:hypothetical protein
MQTFAPAQTAPANPAVGCAKIAGVGCGGVLALSFLLALIGTCSGRGRSETNLADLGPQPVASAPAPTSLSTEQMYVHGTVPVRHEPSIEAAVVRTLHRGETVRLGPADGGGWAALYPAYGDLVEGYVDRSSPQIRSYPPSSDADATGSASSPRTSRSTGSGSGYYLGPRGGCYTYSASGRKRYVDHSYCSR